MEPTDHVSPSNVTSPFKTKYILVGIIFLFLSLSIILNFLAGRRSNHVINTILLKNLNLNISISILTTTTPILSTSTTTPVPTTSTTTPIISTSTTSASSTTIKTTLHPTPTPEPTKTVTPPTTFSSTTTSFDEILCNNMSNHRQVNQTEHPCERIRCAVILRKSGGRLGNRMFMFASAYGLARTHHCRLHVSDQVNRDLFENFQMTPIEKTMWLSSEAVERLKDIHVEYNVCSFISSLIRPRAIRNLELTGFWQSYLYFDGYRDEIRQFFGGRNTTLIRLASYFTGLLAVDCPLCAPLPSGSQEELRQAFRTRYNITWISIQIRRADFRSLGYSSDDNYIRQAMSHYRRRYHSQQIRFLVASDDKRFCNEFFFADQGHRRVFVLPEDFPAAEDLISLSLCHHSIVSGGTYSFWSAYLAGGDVLHDIRYSTGCTPAEYYPPWFMLIGAPFEKKQSAGKRRRRWSEKGNVL